jgi:hypothetical protein
LRLPMPWASSPASSAALRCSCASTLRAERTGCKHGPTTCGAVVSVR